MRFHCGIGQIIIPVFDAIHDILVLGDDNISITFILMQLGQILRIP